MRALASSLLGIVFVTWAGFANADETPSKRDQRARAQELFDSALVDAEAGNFAAACPKFLASQDADPKTSTLLNLGNCYEKNNQSASAWGAFREAETAARKIGRTDWEASARKRAEALEPKLIRLSIVVPEASRAPGLVVVRDGSKVSTGEWGVAIPVDPGVHVVTASADGRESFATQVDIGAASTTVTVPVLTPVAPPSPEPAPPPATPAPATDKPSSHGWSTWKTAGAITAGAGAVTVIVSGVLALVANGRYDDAQASCAAPPRGCSSGAVADADSAYGLAGAATAVMIVGAVGLAAGGALFFLAPENKPGPRVAVGPGGIVGRW